MATINLKLNVTDKQEADLIELMKQAVFSSDAKKNHAVPISRLLSDLTAEITIEDGTISLDNLRINCGGAQEDS